MSAIEPGWYKDPADPTTQRYWDGEGWLGDPIPADATPPAGPPPTPAPAPPAPGPMPIAASPMATSAPPAMAPPAPPGVAGAPGAPVPPGAAGPAAWPGYPGYPPGYLPVFTEPRPHGLRLAGAGSRFVARLIDTLIVFGLVVIANAWFAIEYWRDISPYVDAMLKTNQTDISAMPMLPESATFLPLLMCLVATAVWFAYEVPSMSNSGQTLGKRLLGIKVVRLESEDRLGFGRAFHRWSRLGLPTLFWFCWGFGFLLQFIDCLFVVIDRPLRQALHDKSAATVVIELPRPGRPETARMNVPESTTTGGRHVDPR